jgi:hypothetical protein
MTRGRHCCAPMIALREPPTLLGEIGRMDPDLSFGDGMLSITIR